MSKIRGKLNYLLEKKDEYSLGWMDIVAGITGIFGIMEWVVFMNYVISCESFYGINKKYFYGMEIMRDRLFSLFAFAVVFFYLFALLWGKKKLKIETKIGKIVIFLVIYFFFFMLDVLYTDRIIHFTTYGWLRTTLRNENVLLALRVVYLLTTGRLAYLLVVNDVISKITEYNLNLKRKIIFTIEVFIFLCPIVYGICFGLIDPISNKRVYEVIEQNRVIISEYNNAFVVMDCKIQGDTLIIEKGEYRLEEMINTSITYHEYEQVICG